MINYSCEVGFDVDLQCEQGDAADMDPRCRQLAETSGLASHVYGNLIDDILSVEDARYMRESVTTIAKLKLLDLLAMRSPGEDAMDPDSSSKSDLSSSSRTSTTVSLVSNPPETPLVTSVFQSVSFPPWDIMQIINGSLTIKRVLKHDLSELKQGWTVDPIFVVQDAAAYFAKSAFDGNSDVSVDVPVIRHRTYDEAAGRHFVIPEGIDLLDISSISAACNNGELVSELVQPKSLTTVACHMANHTDCCRAFGHESQLANRRVHVAGPCCWDHTSNGQGQGLLGKSMMDLLAFIIYIWIAKPHILILENVLQFPVPVLVLFLGCLYEIDDSCSTPSMCWCPTKTSDFPTARPRMYLALYLKGAVIPQIPLADVLIQLEALHTPHRFVAKDLFFADTVGSYPLSASARKFLSRYKELHPYLDVFDLCNNPDLFHRAESERGALMAITRSSKRIYSISKCRWLLPSEILLAQGLPVTQWAAAHIGVACQNQILKYPEYVQFGVAGNSMHLVVVYQVLASVLVHAQWL
jgi:hypothetical protein